MAIPLAKCTTTLVGAVAKTILAVLMTRLLTGVLVAFDPGV